MFAKLATVGSPAVTNSGKERFKKEIETYSNYTPTSVVARPGWCESAYAFGDATSSVKRGAERSSHVGFDGNEKFAAVGRLSDWQDAFGPIVRNQPLPIFAFLFAFVGPLLRFAPPDFQNAIVEIAGEAQSGKTALGIAASSVWGGNPNSSIGFGESWDQTLHSLDEVQSFHRDGLLFLDEANHVGKTKREQAEYLRMAVFKLTATSPRRRLGDGQNAEHTKLAILSTSNSPLHELVGCQTGSDRAVLSRVLTLYASRKFGIFDFVPEGFGSAREAAEALHTASNEAYGSAGRAFIEHLQKYTEDGLRRAVMKGLRAEETQKLFQNVADPRISKILAMTYLAGRLAREFGILPRDWGSLKAAVVAMKPLGTEAVAARSSFDAVISYIAEHGDNFIKVEDDRLPLDRDAFNACPGFWMGKGLCVISSQRFQKSIPHAEASLKGLRDQGKLDADEGNFSKKASLKLCKPLQRPRAYYIHVEPICS